MSGRRRPAARVAPPLQPPVDIAPETRRLKLPDADSPHDRDHRHDRQERGRILRMTVSRLTVLVADDSALYRQMLQNVLRRIPGVEVVGVAVDGIDALEQAARLHPDVITLDVQMPRLDGLAVLRELRRQGHSARVIMVSSLTRQGAPATVEALLEGAFDVVPKPADEDPHVARESIHAALVEKLAAVVDALAPETVPLPPLPLGRGRRAAFDLVAIGTSTGGPEALRAILPRLPHDWGPPTVVVQHMPAGFTASLAARLDELAAVRVREATDGMRLELGQVVIAPGSRHLRLHAAGDALVCGTDAGPPRQGCRPSFDELLESLPGGWAGRTLAVVLTGMGRDGLAGCRRIRDAGGCVVAQAAEGCTVWGMPKAVVTAGLATAVVRLGDMAADLASRVRGGGGPMAR